MDDDDRKTDEQPEAEPDEATPEEFENDPARNPDDERLKDIKGG